MLREIERRGSESGHEFRYIRVDNKIYQWRKFLSNSKNKLLLIPLRIDSLERKSLYQLRIDAMKSLLSEQPQGS